MWRFILRENLLRYRSLLETAEAEADRERLRRLIAESQRELAELEELSSGPFTGGETAVVMARAIEQLMDLTGAQFGSIHLFEASADELVLAAQRNFRIGFLKHFRHVAIGDGSAGARCYTTGLPLIIEDVRLDPAFAEHLDVALDAGFWGMYCAPLRDEDGGVYGVVSVHFREARQVRPSEEARWGSHADDLGRSLAACLLSGAGRPLPSEGDFARQGSNPGSPADNV